MEGCVSAKANLLTYEGESPSMWLAPGDLAQTYYNAPIFEAYLFAVFNRFHLNAPDITPPDLFNGMMEGVPIYATLGNHNWNKPYSGYCTSAYCEEGDINCCKGTGGTWHWYGGSASEQMSNLLPPAGACQRF